MTLRKIEGQYILFVSTRIRAWTLLFAVFRLLDVFSLVHSYSMCEMDKLLSFVFGCTILWFVINVLRTQLDFYELKILFYCIIIRLKLLWIMECTHLLDNVKLDSDLFAEGISITKNFDCSGKICIYFHVRIGFTITRTVQLNGLIVCFNGRLVWKINTAN